MKSQGLAALAMAQEGTVIVSAKESHGAHLSLAAGSVSEYLDANQGRPQPFVCNFSEIYFPSAATSQASLRAACLKLFFHPPHSDHPHGQVISGVFGLQFYSLFLSTFLGFHHLTAKSDRPVLP